MAMTRVERRKNIQKHRKLKKRKKRPFKLTMVVLLFFVATIGYATFEFYSGYIDAAGKEPEVSNPSSTGDTTEQESQEDDFNGVEDLEKINVLILGVDSTSAENGRTDTIMIAQYDPKNDSAKIASIMRDTYVSIPGYKNNKINSAYFHGGPELVRKTIKKNFGIDVQYYAVVDFDGFAQVVDVLSPNGVEIDVEKRMKYTDRAGGLYIDFQAGLQKLDGEDLLKYARFRHDAESDFGRVRRQQQVISAIKDELISINGLVKLPKMMGTIQPYIDTNVNTKTILALGTSFLTNPKEIDTIRIPVDGSYSNKSYSHAGSVLDININKNKQALDEFFNAKKPIVAKNDDEKTEE